MNDFHIPAEWASDGVLKENVTLCDISPDDWQHPNTRCPICGQKECNCQAKLISSRRSFTKVLCCWNCCHRVGGIGPRGCSDGGCGLTNSGVVPPDRWCNQHKEKA